METKQPYHPVTPDIVDELRALVGDRYVLFGDRDALEPFSHDEIPDPKYHAFPEAVVRPESTEQIAAIVQLANRERIPVTPRGAGSGLSGGNNTGASPRQITSSRGCSARA